MTERLKELFHRGCVEEEFPQDIHLYTQKGNPEVFDRQDLFQKVNADSEMIDDFHIARQLHEKCQKTESRPIYGACQLH